MNSIAELVEVKKMEIFLQVWDKQKYPNAQVWDDIPAVASSVTSPAKFGQDIANIFKSAVRMTYQWNNLPAGRLNGSYFVPKD